MKKLTIFILIFFTSAPISAADPHETQHKMNVFQRAIKNTQNKLSLYGRCFKKQCTPQEKEEAYQDAKTAAKVAIPTGIGLVVAIGGSVLLYKKFGARIATWYKGDTLSEVTALKDAIDKNNAQFIQQELDKGLDLKKYTINNHPFIFYVLTNGSPEMFSMILAKHPELANQTDKVLGLDKPLLTTAIQHDNKKTKTLLGLPNIDVRPQVPAGNLPLYMAVKSGYAPHIELILKKYSKENLVQDIEKIKNSNPPHKNAIISEIERYAKNFEHLR